MLERYNVKAELTATKRAAIHRYTFPEAEDAGFILDFDYSIERQTNEEMKIEVISDTEIRGHKKRYIGHSTSISTSMPSFPSRLPIHW